MLKHFGASASKEDLLIYAQSPNWDGKKFVNLEETRMDITLSAVPSLLYKQIFEKTGRDPSKQLPIHTFDRDLFLHGTNEISYAWYGHSALLFRVHSKVVLIDPMFGSNAAPISPFPVKRYSRDTLNLIDEFPEIDLVLLSHDHYDHLDYDSIQRLAPKVKRFFVAMGVGRHLVKWGISKDSITEFQWWDNKPFDEINITFTPSRHFSGRGLTDRARSLWGGWVLKTNEKRIWFSGDGGYGEHFKEIGERIGPMDIGFMECGQYNKLWHQIHMYPEESVQAAMDVGVKTIMPVHWAGFSLALHPWKEPVERFVAECERRMLAYTVPSKGKIINIYEDNAIDKWWESF